MALAITLLDEPQNIETEKLIAASENLKALRTLRYSATHRNHLRVKKSNIKNSPQLITKKPPAAFAAKGYH